MPFPEPARLKAHNFLGKISNSPVNTHTYLQAYPRPRKAHLNGFREWSRSQYSAHDSLFLKGNKP